MTERDSAKHVRSALPLIVREGRVEGAAAGAEVDLLDVVGGFGCAVVAVHAAVFPFDRERTVVVDVVEGPDDLFEIHGASAGAAEVPATPRVAKIEMACQNSRPAVERRDGVLDMYVIDPLGKGADEFDWIDTLPMQMARIEIKSKFLPARDWATW